ncbi:hypothetical protein ACOME3_009087 [Neoechinorhynchus agilis]
MLDSYYRTLEGFMVLIEKEWISFGHKFMTRVGHGEDNYGDSDRSPIFLQFIDAVYQFQRQYSCAFEFNEYFLITILDHLYSCQFGTFICNSERERSIQRVASNTVSLWSYVLQNRTDFLNPFYSPGSTHGYKQTIYLIPSMRFIRLWKNYYCRYSYNFASTLDHQVLRFKRIEAAKQRIKDEIEKVKKEVKNVENDCEKRTATGSDNVNVVFRQHICAAAAAAAEVVGGITPAERVAICAHFGSLESSTSISRWCARVRRKKRIREVHLSRSTSEGIKTFLLPNHRSSKNSSTDTVSVTQQAINKNTRRTIGTTTSDKSKSSRSSCDRFYSPSIASFAAQGYSKMTKFANKKVLCNKLRTKTCPGLLKLHIYEFPGVMTINVIEAKQLIGLDEECNPFVRVRLTPDSSNRVNCRTMVVYGTNSPTYNEKFSFEICKDDLDRRLLITSYHLDRITKAAHVIGSMSFSIRNLHTRYEQVGPDGIYGWFYLLPDDLGQSKHKQIPARTIEQAKAVKTTKVGISELNQDMIGLRNIAVRIPRTEYGYGLSVAGNCPCRITRVNQDNFNRNIHVGDFIVGVNGRNVSRATLGSVVKLIRKLDAQELVLNLCRQSDLPRLELQPKQQRSSSDFCGIGTPKYLGYTSALSNRLNNLPLNQEKNNGYIVGHSEV